MKTVPPLGTWNKEVGTALEYYQSGQIKKHEIGRYVARTGQWHIYKKKNSHKTWNRKKLYSFYQAAMLQGNRPSNISSSREFLSNTTTISITQDIYFVEGFMLYSTW